MAKIHILDGSKREQVGAVISGSMRVVFHIPVQAPVVGVVPSAESVVPNIDATELTAYEDGELLELLEVWNYNDSVDTGVYVAMLKERWAILNTECNAQYDYEHKFYLQEIDW